MLVQDRDEAEGLLGEVGRAGVREEDPGEVEREELFEGQLAQGQEDPVEYEVVPGLEIGDVGSEVFLADHGTGWRLRSRPREPVVVGFTQNRRCDDGT